MPKNKSFLLATDWSAIQRTDGSIFFTCGGVGKPYHMAFDVSMEDAEIAKRFVAAMNAFNSTESPDAG